MQEKNVARAIRKAFAAVRAMRHEEILVRRTSAGDLFTFSWPGAARLAWGKLPPVVRPRLNNAESRNHAEARARFEAETPPEAEETVIENVLT